MKSEIQKQVIEAFADTANEITAYLESEAPSETHPDAIDAQLMNLCKKICEIVG